MKRLLLPLAAAVLVLAGCRDTTAPRDTIAPAAPRGLYSVTGDGQVTLYWIDNTERDLSGYRVYEGSCSNGPGCPYERVGATTGTSYVVAGLTNGVTRYFAVAAVDQAGNESALSEFDVFDTPRPAGTGLVLTDYSTGPSTSGYDFSAYRRQAWDLASTDIFYGYYVDAQQYQHAQIFALDTSTDIQDAGYANTLDAVDYAPTQGWSPSGTVEAIVGHCYIVWTRDDHYAKFRVTGVSPTEVTMDWAYQVDVHNRELSAKPVRPEGGERRPIVWLPK